MRWAAARRSREVRGREAGMSPREAAAAHRKKSLTRGTANASHPPMSRRTVVAWTTESKCASSSTSRRARISPEEAGLPVAGQRRVPGLRRSEVAALAGMSVEYYAKLERGSRAVGRRARRDRLGPAARRRRAGLPPPPGARGRRSHRPAQPSPQARGDPAQPAMDAGHHHHGARDRREQPAGLPRREPPRPQDVLRPARPGHPTELRQAHLPRRCRPPVLPGLGPRRCAWRTCAPPPGKDPHDKGLHDLVGELSTRNDEFRRRWGAHNVRTTAAVSSTSTTTSSATSPSPMKASTCAANPASR